MSESSAKKLSVKDGASTPKTSHVLTQVSNGSPLSSAEQLLQSQDQLPRLMHPRQLEAAEEMPQPTPPRQQRRSCSQSEQSNRKKLSAKKRQETVRHNLKLLKQLHVSEVISSAELVEASRDVLSQLEEPDEPDEPDEVASQRLPCRLQANHRTCSCYAITVLD